MFYLTFFFFFFFCEQSHFLLSGMVVRESHEVKRWLVLSLPTFSRCQDTTDEGKVSREGAFSRHMIASTVGEH